MIIILYRCLATNYNMGYYNVILYFNVFRGGEILNTRAKLYKYANDTNRNDNFSIKGKP